MGITLLNFNYTCVIMAIVLILCAVFWWLPEKMGGARHNFAGPLFVGPDKE